MLLIFSLITVPLTSFASDDITLVVNGKQIETDVKPMIINNRTMVPVRALFNAFGAEISWNEVFRQVVLNYENNVIVLTVDSDVAYLNGLSQKLDVPPVIIDGRTLVPVRFISESLGYTVEWNDTNRTVNIYNVPQSNDSKPDSVVSDKPEFKSVVVSTRTEYTKITINLSENVIPKVMTLTSPHRIVFDYYGVNQICSDSNKKFDNYAVTGVRWAKHENYTRVVVESNSKLQYVISSNNSESILTIYTGVTSQNKPDNNSNNNSDNNKGNPIVVIDAGHGGSDCGAVGRDQNGNVVIYEANVNLDIALRVQKRLSEKGVNVIMTRTTDVSLGDSVMSDLVKRADIANKANADLFVSVHNNSFSNPEATGTTVLYAGLANSGNYGITSYEFALIMQKYLVGATGLKDRGLTQSPGIVVLKRTDMPAVLLECAFVSCYNDQKVLTDNDKLNKIADAVCEGIIVSLKKMGRYS